MLALARVCGCAVGEVDGVEWDDIESGCVVLDCAFKVLLLHRLVAQPLQSLGFIFVGSSRSRSIGRWGLRSRRSRFCSRRASLGCGGGLTLEFLVDIVDCQEALSAQCVFLCRLVVDIDLEGFGDAVCGNLELFCVVGSYRAIRLRSLEEVKNRERKALLGLAGCLDVMSFCR